MSRLVFVLLAMALLACGDPVADSTANPIDVNLQLKAGEAVDGILSAEKVLNTEPQDYFGEFIKRSQNQMGTDTIASVTVTELTILLDASSTGVTNLGDVFDRDVELSFLFEDRAVPVGAAVIEASQGPGPVTVPADFDSHMLSASHYAMLLSGDFRVHLEGPAKTGFEESGADVKLLVTLKFSAYRR